MMEPRGGDIEERAEKSARNVFFSDYRVVISAFIAGIGVLMWITMFIFNPMNQFKLAMAEQGRDIALIKNDISTIKSNHEQHIQDILQQMKDIKLEHTAQDARLEANQKSIIVLMTLHGYK